MTPVPRLTLEDIHVEAIRCHKSTSWMCTPGINMFIGENGCGKTTVLEAVCIMARGRSFRQFRDPNLIRWGDKQFRITGKWKRYGPLNVQVSGEHGKMNVLLQSRMVQRRNDLTETLPVIVDAPHASKLVDGAPNERRRWLDGLIIACMDGIQTHYLRYLRCLMQRNRLLRRGCASSEVEGWEHQLVFHGQAIMSARKQMVESLNDILIKEEQLTEAPVHLNIKITAPASEKDWLRRLAKQRHIYPGSEKLYLGPHCDKLHIDYQGREIRSAGSRGQQKLVAMALRLAECEIRTQHRGLVPVLLLDDCFESLDTTRQHQLLTRLHECRAQVLITAPHGLGLDAYRDIQVHEMPPQPAAMTKLRLQAGYVEEAA